MRKKSFDTPTAIFFAFTLSLLQSQNAYAAPETTCSITVSESNITVTGTDLSDLICILGNNDVIQALDGDDKVVDDGTGNVVYLGDGNDSYDGSQGDTVSIDAGAGDDSVLGTPGDDVIIGSEGNDTLSGGAGADQIIGSSGQDILRGGDGLNVLAGGEGLDAIETGPNQDYCDYSTGEQIQFSCRYDENAPSADTFTFTPNAVDVTNGPASIEVSLKAYDDTGINYSYLQCRVSETRSTIGLQPSMPNLNQNNRTFTSNGTLTIPKGSMPGVYQCWWQATDVSGNSTPWSWLEPGIRADSTFTVIDSSSADFTTPQISNLNSLSSEIDSSVTSEFAVTATLVESSNYWANLICFLPDSAAPPLTGIITGGTNWYADAYNHQSPSLNNQVTFEMFLTKNSPPGDYGCFLQAGDDQGNYQMVKPTDFSIHLVRSELSSVDFEAPVISTTSTSRAIVDSSQSDSTLDLTLHVSDATGASLFAGFCGSKGSDPYAYSGHTLALNFNPYDSTTYQTTNFGSPNMGVSKSFDVTLRVAIPFGTPAGDYDCYVFAQDQNGNVAQKLVNWIGLSPGYTSVGAKFTVLRHLFGQPSEPKEVKFVASGENPTQGVLSWSAPEVSGATDLKSYEVQVSEDNGANWISSYVKDLFSPLQNLRANRDYEIRVRAVNNSPLPGNVDDSELSWAVSKYRFEAQLPSSPRSLTFSDVSAKKLTVKFEPPASDGGSDLVEMRLEVSTGTGPWKSITSPGTLALNSSVSGLIPGNLYNFRVSAINRVGQSHYLVGSMTTLDKPPVAPSSLMIKALKATVTLSWKAKNFDDASPITNFYVQYSRNGKAWSNIKKEVSSSRSITIRGLLPKSKYSFRVFALSRAGTSPASKVLSLSTK